MSDEAYDYWSQAIADVYASDEWKKIMTDNGLMPFGKTGPELTEFVKQQVADIQVISKDIGLIK
jgi:putative tricarboxylic transport membrane protein